MFKVVVFTFIAKHDSIFLCANLLFYIVYLASFEGQVVKAVGL